MSNNKSLFGLDENIVAALSYVCGPVTGFIALVMEKDNKFVRFHAMQSVIGLGILMILSFVLSFVPVIGTIVSVAVGIVAIFLFIQAFQGKKFKLPIIGDVVEKQVQ